MPRLGTLFIFSSVLLYGLYPVLIALVPKNTIPPLLFLMNIHGLAFGILCLVLLGAIIWPKLSSEKTLFEISYIKLLVDREILMTGLANAICNVTAFGALYYAIQSGPVLETAILYELWATIFLVYSFFRRSGTHGEFKKVHDTTSTIIFFLIGAAGIVAVSIGAHFSSIEGQVQGNEKLITGFTFDLPLLAAIASPFLMAGSFIFNTRNALALSKRMHPEGLEPSKSEPRFGIFGAMLVEALMRCISFLMAAVLFILFHKTEASAVAAAYTQDNILIPMIIMGFLVGFGGVAAPIGNNLNRASNANLLYYFVPFFTVLWLYFFGLSDKLQSISFLGAILVLAANFILTSDFKHSFAFKSAIATLCISASAVFLIEPFDIVPRYELIGALIGVFGILSAFLIDRINNDARDKRDLSDIEFAGKAILIHGQSVFVLWILAFGIIIALFGYRITNDYQHDFLIVVLTVAITYIALVPVEAIAAKSGFLSQNISVDSSDILKSIWPLIISAIFIASLFLLLFFGLLLRPPF